MVSTITIDRRLTFLNIPFIWSRAQVRSISRSSQILRHLARLPSHKEKVLNVKKMECLGHRLRYYSKRLLEVLTWSAEVALNTDLKSEKEGVLPITKALLNLGDGLESLSRVLDKVIEPLIAVVGFQGVELGELLGSRGVIFCSRSKT